MIVSMITTNDNPYDPFTQFDDWYAFDERHGYHSCAYLDRVSKSSSDLSPEDQAFAINNAIDEIIKYNVLGIYKKVSKEVNQTF